MLRRGIKMSADPNLLQKMRGSMVGAVIGDCLGSPVECQFWDGIEPGSVLKHFSAYRERACSQKPKRIRYTDDTAMARQIAYSLIERKKLEPVDLATRFWKEHDREPWRGYGASVSAVFEKLKRDSDPFEAAKQQFDGKGSYGNGAAMRVHPIGLFYSNVEDVAANAEQSAQITHSHRDGVNGAIVQAVATHLALKDVPVEEILQQLKNLAKDFNASGADAELTYASQLELVSSMLESPEHDFESSIELGNCISAIKSVPTALYSFLKAQNAVALDPDSKSTLSSNPFERTIQLAMTFGGDSDTICSMAGALAGARYGEAGIPDYMKIICEGVSDARQQAEELYKIVVENKPS